MADDASLVIVAGLGLIVVLTVTSVLRTLAAAHKRELDIHNLILESNEMRRRYIETVARRRGINVEIVDDDDPPGIAPP